MNDLASGIGLDPHGAVGQQLILGAFLLFCRIGACLLLMPGFSSPQIPAHVRLFLALAVTLSLTPLLLGQIPVQAISDEPITALRYIGAELLIGGAIGMLGRLFLLALETLASAGAMAIGLSNPFGVIAEESEILPPFVTLITMSATALIFIMDLHWEIFRGIAASYDAIPVKGNFDASFSLLQFSKLLTSTFQIALRISAPFIIYTVIIQTTISIINRLTPHISVYFISAPFVIFGGLLITYFVIKSMLGQLMVGFLSWLSTG